ncbi:MFS transporter [Streptomyces rubradiris]|uniref:MFS transporter n=1 Tax=Streptomyces rubradiris TaxID=285531 RepID=A0ABQ3RA58_STRRR|nr:MFS transporter [Streptomyces rubradiris]GHH25835.1 MFS transporter [Streptomyces rubradiris]GHI52753.1 MFS transporter [Streptomyces rubradiris]
MPATVPVQQPAAAPATRSANRQSHTRIWVLVVGAGAVRAAGFSYPFLPYRLSDLGFSTTGISGVLALYGLGWLAGQILWGRLADALGRRTTLISAMTVAAVTLPLLAQATNTLVVGAAAIIAGVVYDAPRPVISAAVADEIPDESARASITGWRHFAVNVGAAVTGAAGGLLADRTGLPFLFWINALACAAFAVIVTYCVRPDQPPAATTHTGPARHRLAKDARLWLLWLASVLAFVPIAGLFSVMPLLMDRQRLPASAYGWTQAASAAAVLLLSLPLNRWLARKAKKTSMVGILAASSLILGAGIGSAGLASTTPQYAAAAAAAVPGEIAAFVAATAIIDRIAPPHARGLYAGIWGTTLATAIMCAPELAGWSLTQGGPRLVGLTTLACGLAGATVCMPLGLLLRRRPGTAAGPDREAPV